MKAVDAMQNLVREEGREGAASVASVHSGDGAGKAEGWRFPRNGDAPLCKRLLFKQYAKGPCLGLCISK